MESKSIKKFTALFLVGLWVAHMIQPSSVMSSEPLVRVAVLNEVNDFIISIRGKYRITDPQTRQKLSDGKKLGQSQVSKIGQGIKIADKDYNVRHMRIIVKKDITVYSDGHKKKYRGQLDIIRGNKDQFLVINLVDLEDYVKGVLYHEVPYYWPMETIKAQAIATRTYVLFRKTQKKDELFDVTSDIYSQVYGGRNAERHRSNIAANRTRGHILKYQGKILPAYFHSTCGGKTENVKELWKHDLKPLRGIQCDYCTLSPHYKWKKNFKSKDIQEQLSKHGYNLDLIKSIDIVRRTESGRVKLLNIKTRKGRTIKMRGAKFRKIIGPNKLKSNFYDIKMEGYFFDVIGRGWGHGVGMCQWGAYYMAQNRIKYKEILQYYYPGSTIKKVSEL